MAEGHPIVKCCCRCNEAKPLTDFYKGYGHCKACHSKAMKASRTKHRESVAAYNRRWHASEVGKESMRRFLASDRGKTYRTQAHRRFKASPKGQQYMAQQKADGKLAARASIGRAIRTGIIPRARELSCRFCGKPAAEFHHLFGYAPEHHLDVVPLCRCCHKKADAH